MHRADKAVLRLAVGMGLSVLFAYGAGLQLAFTVPTLAVVLLCKPGPPIPVVKGMVLGLVIAALLVAGVLMVPVLRHYPLTGVVLVGALLYAVSFAGALKANPLTFFLIMAIVLMPVAGVADQQLVTVLAQGIGLAIAGGVLATVIVHALFADPPGPARAVPPLPRVSAESARWSALQATLVVMPVFLLALTNPPAYLPMIMKTVALAQQSGSLNARTAGRELVGSTLMGAVMAAVVWGCLTMRANLWMLTLWVVAASLWTGVRLFRIKPTSFRPSYWVNALMTMLILLGPAMEDSANGKDVYLASAVRVSLFVAVALHGWAVVWLVERWRGARSPLASA